MVLSFLGVFKRTEKKYLNLYHHCFFIVLFIFGILSFLFMISMDNWQWSRIKQYTRSLNYLITINDVNDNVKTINDYIKDREDSRDYIIKSTNSNTAKDINGYTKVYLNDYIIEDGMNGITQATADDSKKSSFHHIRIINNNRGTLQDPTFLTIDCNGGRLGNQMFTYATLLGLSNLNNRTPYAKICNMNKLRPYFHVTAKEINDLPKDLRKEYKLSSYFRSKDEHIPNEANVLSGYSYPNSFTFFDHIRDQIKTEFRFKEHIMSYVHAFITKLRNLNSTALIVGIHVRMTDYNNWLQAHNGRLVTLKYFSKAMQYFRIKFNDVIFVVISDDRNWCKEHLGNWTDVVVAPNFPNPAYDMALLSQFNHTIITYGTFGFWCAYLAGGETIYFAEYLLPNSSFLEKLPYNKTYLPQWIGISDLE